MRELVAWDRVTSDELEALCVPLLDALGFINIQRTGGPGDRGRDLRCEFVRAMPVPNFTAVERWVVECKLRTTGGLNTNDIESAVSWAMSRDDDGFLVITNSHFTAATVDYLENLGKRMGKAVQWIDGVVLEQLLSDRCADVFERLPKLPLPEEWISTESAHNEIFERLSGIDPEAPLADTHLAPLSNSTIKRLTTYSSLVTLHESHLIEYGNQGTASRTISSVLANLGSEPVEYDTRRFYGDIDTSFEELHLQGTGLTHVRPALVRLATHKLLLVDLHLAKAIEPGGLGAYEISYDWPHPQPLGGVRYYSSYSLRPKLRLSIEVTLPRELSLASASLLRQEGGIMRRAEVPELSSDHSALRVSCQRFRFRETASVNFAVEKRAK